MKFNELKKEKIFSKVYTKARVETFVQLIERLRCKLSIYITAYKSLRFLREDDFDKSRHEDLQYKINETKKEIEFLLSQIEEFFNEGFFQEITKKQADEISDIYQELVKEIIIIDMTIEREAWQKFTNLISFYNEKVLPIFEILNDNIDTYNNKANENGWKYKIRSYDEAVDYYNQNFKLAKANHRSKKPATEWKKVDSIMSFEEFKEQFDKRN